jgi:hypothetical protein
MAYNSDQEIPAGTWTQVGDDAAEAFRVQELEGEALRLQATATSSAPSATSGGVFLRGFETLAADLAIEDLFPGIGSGSLYLWAYCSQKTRISTSHA